MSKSYFARIDVVNKTMFHGDEYIGSAIAEVFDRKGDDNYSFKEYHILGNVQIADEAKDIYGKDFAVGGIFFNNGNFQGNIGFKMTETVLSREEARSLNIYRMQNNFNSVRLLSDVKIQTYTTKWNENGEFMGVEKNHVYNREDGVPTNVEEAAKWLLENHPEEYPGANITQQCPIGDLTNNLFGFDNEDNKETAEAKQKAFIEEEMEKYGIEPDRDEDIER